MVSEMATTIFLTVRNRCQSGVGNRAFSDISGLSENRNKKASVEVWGQNQVNDANPRRKPQKNNPLAKAALMYSKRIDVVFVLFCLF